MNNIGSRIRGFREEKGITQEYMADTLEITQSNYCRLGSVQKTVSLEISLQI